VNQKHKKPIKGAKDLDCSLDSNEILNQKIVPWLWHPGPGNLDQKCVNPIMMLPTNTRKLSNFEQLTSSITWWVMVLQFASKKWVLRDFKVWVYCTRC